MPEDLLRGACSAPCGTSSRQPRGGDQLRVPWWRPTESEAAAGGRAGRTRGGSGAREDELGVQDKGMASEGG